MIAPWSRQSDSGIRFEWGPVGVEALQGDLVVVIDVLRFTTAVEAATSRGAAVFPYRAKDETAHAYARQVGAALADGANEHGRSLSPVSLLTLEEGDRIVLPSPNGSTCAVDASEAGSTVVAACLRNAAAVAAWLTERGGTVTVIAGGERWPDGSLRPALEDYLGAGAVIASLEGELSPEARAAAGAWHDVEQDLPDVLAECSSARECRLRGWEDDLRYASQVSISDVVPVLRDEAFINVIV